MKLRKREWKKIQKDITLTCMGQFQKLKRIKGKIKNKCDWCGVVVEKYKSQLKYKNIFCGLVCRAKFTGNKLSNDLEYKEKMRLIAKRNGNKPPRHKKEKHWNWKGGISKISRGQDYKYRQWRKDVLAKYKFICQHCFVRGGKLSAHHIVHWSDSEELRYDINNGLCLCYQCHMKHHGLKKK